MCCVRCTHRPRHGWRRQRAARDCANGERCSLHVVWQDTRDGGTDIYANRSTGWWCLTWLVADHPTQRRCTAMPELDRTPTAWPSTGATTCTRSGRRTSRRRARHLPQSQREPAAPAWLADRHPARHAMSAGVPARRRCPTSASPASNIYVCVAGRTQRSTPTCISTAVPQRRRVTWLEHRHPPGYERHRDQRRSLSPRICCDGASVAVAWYDDRNGRHGHLSSAGRRTPARRWLTSRRARRSMIDEPGVGHSITPQVCCTLTDRVVDRVVGPTRRTLATSTGAAPTSAAGERPRRPARLPHPKIRPSCRVSPRHEPTVR